VGVVSLRDLLLADPQATMEQVMRPVESIARPLDEERDVARLIADEDLVALPVVDDVGKMLGIVTVDDAIDVILPTAWKKRMPRAFH
jgi:Mg/Co/Ni transporter MgtE